ncbi:MAG: PaaI family thioesterase [Sulfobacillus sp.]
MIEEMANHLFYTWAGLRVVQARGGQAVVELDVKEHHRGGGGTRAINGGIVAYLFDGLLGAAVGSTWTEDIVGQVTVTLNIQYQRMLQAEHTVVGRGRVTNKGSAMVFVAGEVYDESGEVAATCTGVYRVFRKR